MLPEKQVKEELGIDKFNKIPVKDTIIQLTSKIHELSDKTATAVIEQFGNFKDLATSTFEKLSKVFERSIESTDNIDGKAIEAYQTMLNDLREQANISEDINDQERIFQQEQFVLDRIERIANDHREYNQMVLKYGAVSVALVVIFGFGMLGGNINLGDLNKINNFIK